MQLIFKVKELVLKNVFCLLILTITLANAQDMTAEEILTELEQTIESLEDIEFLLFGTLFDAVNNEEIELEVELQLIREEEVGKAYFVKPEALADNFIVYNDAAVYNYLFLTNQVTILDATDPDALGSLFSEVEDPDEKLDLDLSLETLFVNWDTSVLSYEDTPLGKAYRLRFNDTTDDTDGIDHVVAVIAQEMWTPYQMSFYGQDDTLLAELEVVDFRRNIDLDPEEITYIPEDVEVIDER